MSSLRVASQFLAGHRAAAWREGQLTVAWPKCEFPSMSTAAPDPFDTFARTHHDALLAFATRLSRNPAEARDLVQDAFERALRNWDRLPPGSNARAWLFTILNNAFIDKCRERAAAPRTESVELTDPPASEKRPPSLSATITSEQLRQAIDELEPEFRIVYVRHALEERSYQQIAAELGIPTNTVGTRLARARRKLRARLIAMAGVEAGVETESETRMDEP